jgi:hypothetical protein
MRRSLIPPALLACCLTAGAMAQETQSPPEKPSVGVRVTSPDNPSVPGVRTPVDPPRTSTLPGAATPATTQDSGTDDETSGALTPGVDAAARDTAAREQVPGTTQDTRRRRTAEADRSTAIDAAAETNDAAGDVPPTLRGVGTSSSRPDCTQLRGIEKSECERRDSTRDDLPAGVTRTQPEQ